MSDQLFFRIVNAELKQFATLANTFDPATDTMLDNEIAMDFNSADSVLNCCTSVVLRDKDNNPAMKATMSCGFVFKAESLDAITKDGVITFPANVLRHIASLTYSTLRGAISVKVEDTSLRGFVLPLQNLYEIIKKPFEVKIEKNS